MTRNSPTWTWYLIRFGVFLVLVGLAGSVRAQDEFFAGICRSEHIDSDVVRQQGPGGTVYLSAIFEGIYYKGSPLHDKQNAEWNQAFLSSIRGKYPDATVSPQDWGRCGLYSSEQGDRLYYISLMIEDIIREFQAVNWRVVFMDWVPPNTRLLQTLRHEDDESEGEGKIFGPKAEKALNAWRDKHGIEDRGAIANTLMLMVQTALILQAFDPGPADGVIGKRTLAAIVAWQTMQGFPEGAELAGLIAAVLRAALVLEGYDPGPVEEMFGPSAIEAVQAWAPSYEQAARNQGSRDRNDRLSPPTSWRTVPHAKDCVSFVRSGGAGNYQFIRNDCDFKIDVHWCYTDRPGDNDYCAPGRAGIGYMDGVGHRATRRGAGPDYYTSSEGLRPHEMTRQRMRLGAIRYIACGHRPLRNAQQYVTEWDAHTAKFRCLAYAPEQDDRTPAEGTAE